MMEESRLDPDSYLDMPRTKEYLQENNPWTFQNVWEICEALRRWTEEVHANDTASTTD